jgi:hypothetical protein
VFRSTLERHGNFIVISSLPFSNPELSGIINHAKENESRMTKYFCRTQTQVEIHFVPLLRLHNSMMAPKNTQMEVIVTRNAFSNVTQRGDDVPSLSIIPSIFSNNFVKRTTKGTELIPPKSRNGKCRGSAERFSSLFRNPVSETE